MDMFTVKSLILPRFLFTRKYKIGSVTYIQMVSVYRKRFQSYLIRISTQHAVL
jgi:hypothetical protein